MRVHRTTSTFFNYFQQCMRLWASSFDGHVYFCLEPGKREPQLSRVDSHAPGKVQTYVPLGHPLFQRRDRLGRRLLLIKPETVQELPSLLGDFCLVEDCCEGARAQGPGAENVSEYSLQRWERDDA